MPETPSKPGNTDKPDGNDPQPGRAGQVRVITPDGERWADMPTLTPPCSTCAGSGWYGDRYRPADPTVYDGHRHCPCGAPCRPCEAGENEGRGTGPVPVGGDRKLIPDEHLTRTRTTPTTRPWPPGVRPTGAQLLTYLRTIATADELNNAETSLDRLLEQSETGARCVIYAHDNLQHELTATRDNLVRLHAGEWSRAHRYQIAWRSARNRALIRGAVIAGLWDRVEDLETALEAGPSSAVCGAKGSLVIGRCGRDAGHRGNHRSTGETFTAEWPNEYDRRAEKREPVAPAGTTDGDRDGVTFTPEFDRDRLNRQARDVYDTLSGRYDSAPAGTWWTLRELADFTGHPEASVSARIRDLRKPRYGGLTIERRRRGEGRGTWEYRLEVTP